MKRLITGGIALMLLLLSACGGESPPQSDGPVFTLEPGVCNGIAGMPFGESYQTLFPGDSPPKEGSTEGSLLGYPCGVYLYYTTGGELAGGYYSFDEAHGTDGLKVYEDILAEMNRCYGDCAETYSDQELAQFTPEQVLAGEINNTVCQWTEVRTSGGDRVWPILYFIRPGVTDLVFLDPERMRDLAK